MDCVRTSVRPNANQLSVYTEEIKKICQVLLEK